MIWDLTSHKIAPPVSTFVCIFQQKVLRCIFYSYGFIVLNSDFVRHLQPEKNHLKNDNSALLLLFQFQSYITVFQNKICLNNTIIIRLAGYEEPEKKYVGYRFLNGYRRINSNNVIIFINRTVFFYNMTRFQNPFRKHRDGEG